MLESKQRQLVFQKTRVPLLVESTKIENPIFPYKTARQKPKLRKIEWEVQKGSNTKNGVLAVTTSFFRKFCFRLKTSYKELI